MTNEQHNTFVGWTFVAHAAFQFLMLLMMGLIFGLVFSIPTRPGEPSPPPVFFGVFFGFMLLLQLAFIIPSLAAAYGIFKRRSWARVASIVAGVLGAMNVPIGTAACVYSLWFFLGDNWKSVYGENAISEEQTRQLIVESNNAKWSGFKTNERGETVFVPVEPPDWRQG